MTVGDNGTLLKSSDGTTWTEITTTAYDNGSGLTGKNDITYGNSTFVTVGGSGTIFTSSNNGTTWTSRSSGTTIDLNGVTYKE